ncbi:hypothetical protein H2204_012168 [Knufia peltigerae]|uniref:Gfd2/YDR514C-like C-terminal domain-containing protein n=1 Tax=Knufia peltigerae TaxID=1002370 RepID=A0AA38XSX6_9EURO|nr:hypothetical protein H2204_012168 [Knufia peltigerae]
MSTSPQSRLDRLFAGKPLPTPPVPGELHFSEKELKEISQKPCQTPAAEQCPQNVPTLPTSQPTPAADVWSSSEDEDDYVAAFKSKPSMKAQNQQPTKESEHVSTIAKSSGASIYKSSNPSMLEPAAHDNVKSVLDSNEQQGKVTGEFCQFFLTAKFPYKYMNDGDDKVSKRFFAANKFYNRDWDIYYVHPPVSLSSKPIILLPFAQVQKLITEIGEAFKIEVSVPDFPFTLKFFDDNTPQPQFLGTSKSRDQFTNLQNSIEMPSESHGECPAKASLCEKQQLSAFRKKCQDALAANTKSGGKSTTSKKKEDDRLLSVHDFNAQLRRLQRYFGLRAKSSKSPHPDVHSSWTSEQEVHQVQQDKIVMGHLKVGDVAPYAFEKEPVFVSVDIESYERAHELITEVGISTLDTLDLIDTPPGENGKNWINCIRSRHFRIRDHAHLVNRDFCVGNPDAFQFGRSEWITLQQAPTEVDNCFKWPFSVQFKHVGLEDPWKTSDTTSTSSKSPQARDGKPVVADDSVDAGQDPQLLQRGPKHRNVILVGHDIRSDLQYLRVLGSKIFKPSRGTYPVAAMEAVNDGSDIVQTLSSIVEALDTAPLYKAFKSESQPRNLGSIASNLGLQCFFLHNGGNDARYTLEALVALAIQARLLEDTKTSGKKGDGIPADQALSSTSDRSGGLRLDDADDVSAMTERFDPKNLVEEENGKEEEEEWEL